MKGFRWEVGTHRSRRAGCGPRGERPKSLSRTCGRLSNGHVYGNNKTETQDSRETWILPHLGEFYVLTFLHPERRARVWTTWSSEIQPELLGLKLSEGGHSVPKDFSVLFCVTGIFLLRLYRKGHNPQFLQRPLTWQSVYKTTLQFIVLVLLHWCTCLLLSLRKITSSFNLLFVFHPTYTVNGLLSQSVFSLS